MSISKFQKLKIFLSSIKFVKNWYEIPFIYYNITNKKIKIIEIKNGLKISLRTNSTDFMQFTTVWLQKEYGIEGFEINNDDVVIDVGAHIGLFALFASQNCKNGKIFCFEPIKDNFKILTENVHLNNLKNVHLNNEVVSKEDGFVNIYLNKDQSGHSIYKKTSEKIRTKSVSLETFFIENITKCNFLKLDCEGAEYEIIESLSDKSMKKIEKICLEYHDVNNKKEKLEKLISKLKANFFDIVIEKGDDGMGFIFAKK